MRFNSLAFRLFATAAAWTLLVLPIAGFIIYRLYRDDVQASFDGQLLKLVNAITVDSMGASGDAQPLPPSNLYEPLFEVTHSGWYWQITPLAPANGRKLVSPSLATGSLPSPAAQEGGARRKRRALAERQGAQGRAAAHRRGDRHARARAGQADAIRSSSPARRTGSTISSPTSAIG